MMFEYSQNYSMISGSLRNYYIDEISDPDSNASDGKSFNYKIEIIGNTIEDLRIKDMLIDH